MKGFPARAVAAVVFALSLAGGAGASQPIVAGANVAVTADPRAPRNEAWIAVDPRDPKHLIGAVTTMRDFNDDHGSFNTTHVSFDGGNTWREVDVAGAEIGGSGDPQVAFGATGTPIFVALAAGVSTSVFRSADGGRSWLHPTTLPFVDHERVAADLGNDGYRGSVYIAGEGQAPKPWPFQRRSDIALFHSRDDGRTFAGPVMVTSNALPLGDPFRGQGDEVVSLQVLRDGTVLVGVLRYTAVRTLRTERLEVYISRDGGKTFDRGHRVGTIADKIFRLAGPHGERTVRHIEDAEFATDRSSGRFAGRVYAVCGTIVHGSSRLVSWRSADGGRTWSRPAFVETAMPGDDYQSNIAVDPRGTVGVVFYHSDADRLPHDHFDVYFAASYDGGAHFAPPVKISSARSYPDAPGNLRPILYEETAQAGALTALFMTGFTWDGDGGDYIGMTAGSDGIFHPLWTDSRTDTFQLETVAIDADGSVPVPSAFSAPRDVTSMLKLIFEPARFDARTQAIAIPIRIQNVSSSAIAGPLTLALKGAQAIRITGHLAPFAGATSEDYGGAMGTRGLLLPGDVTEPIVWTFRTRPDRWREAELTFTARGRVAQAAR